MSDEKVDAWMPLWIGSYMADTMGLDRHEHGGYLLMLFAYWRNKGPLEDNDKDLSNITKCKKPSEWRELRATLVKFFRVADGFWHHGRADEELVKALHHKATAVAKAKAGAEARWSKERKDGSGNAPGNAPSIGQALLGQCPTPSPIPSLLSGESGDDASPPAPAAPTPPPPKSTRRKAKTVIPSEFEVSEAVKTWASKKGFDRLSEHLEAFKLKVAANGYTYADWDAALMTAIRDDWAKLRQPQRAGFAANDQPVTVPSREAEKLKAKNAADDAALAAQDPEERARRIAEAKAFRTKPRGVAA